MVSASTPVELGRVVGGRYVLERLLGSGAMGVVYEATPVEGGAPVAVKLLHRHLLSHSLALKRFRREGRATARLAHPNCVIVLEVETEGEAGDPFLVMELLRGRTLADELRTDFPLPLPRARWIILQVLAAVEAAHRQGIIHRDLKPANVMLVPDGAGGDVVKVCDFGIAKLMDPEDGLQPLGDGTSATAQFLVGTPEYMSPEQARGDALDGRSDVYAAAVMLYQLLTGDVPFRGGSAVGTLARKLAEAPLPPSEKHPGLRLPAALEEVLVRALDRSPDNRPPSAAAFARELEAVQLDDADVAAAAAWALEASGKQLQAPTLSRGANGEAPDVPVASRRRWGWAVPVALAAAIVGVVVARFQGADGGGSAPPAVTALASPDPGRSSEAALAPAPAVVAEVAAAAPPELRAVGGRKRRAHHAPPRAGSAATPEAPLAEADALMVEGRVAQSCAVAERAKRDRPAEPAVYKFLGQCYMRLGKTTEGKAAYTHYLQLRPDAPDAGFIRGILK